MIGVNQECRNGKNGAWRKRKENEMDKDKLTTVVGGIGAAVTAAGPVLNGVQTGSLHQGDWIQLAMAVVFGVLGFFTNKK